MKSVSVCFRLCKFYLLILCLVPSTICFSQWREIYNGPDTTNSINGVYFLTPSTGFLASDKFIGFTTDSGHTYVPRYVTPTNINFNNFYGVTLTAGFSAAGVYAFSTDSLLIYGDFSWEPSILFSADQGRTWKLVYHRPLNVFGQTIWNGITDLDFHGSNGLAVHHEGIIRSSNRGQTWTNVLDASNSKLQKLSFLPSGYAYVVGGNKGYFTYSGTQWYSLSLPLSSSSDDFDNVFFVDNNQGYITESGTERIYRTGSGGSTWTQMNDATIQPIDGTDMYFVNDSTGFMTSGGLFEVYKTSDKGKTWEQCKRNSNYQYLSFGMNSLFFYNNQIGWAAGSKEYLMLNSSGSFPTLPRAAFKIDTNGVASTNVVKLLNYSKTNYQYKWYKDGALISTSYNANYNHDRYKAKDTIQLVVSNGTDTDTSTIYQYFTVPVLPSISSFSPSEGSTGAIIMIRGKSFNSINRVKFGGVLASSFAVVSDSTIRAIVGSGATGDVVIETTSGSVSAAGFTYVPGPTAPPPAILSFSPASGPVGTVVTITGNNFDANASNNIVYFGAVKGKVLSSNSTSVTCTVPFGASYSPISLLNTSTHLTGYSLKPFAVTFADTSNFTQSSFANSFRLSFDPYKYPKEVGAADLDGDGKPDLILSIATARDSITVFRNTSSGGGLSFGQQQNLTDLGYYGSGKFAIEDLDGDGKPDIISTTLLPLKNTSTQGNISFVPQPGVFLLNGTWDLTMGDIDGDGRPDLISADPYKVSVLRNISYPGTISFTLNTDFAANNPTAVAAGDLDGDGLREIVTLNFPSSNISSVSIFKNQSNVGNISFGQRMDITVPGTSVEGRNIKLIDFDGDDKLDVVIANDHDYSILKNTSNGSSISFAPVINYHSPYDIYQSLSFGILNGDAKPDAAFANWSSRGLYLRGNISKQDSVASDNQVEIDGYPNPSGWSTVCADFNMDGKSDIAVSSGSTSDWQVAFFKNNMGAVVPFNVCNNGSTSITADLAGASYQWQIDTGSGFTNLSNNSNYNGTQTKELHFSLIPLSFDGYKFRCIVDGRTSSTYQMKVKPMLLPSVYITASDTTICVGDTVSFSAYGINGGDIPSYQWQINEQNITICPIFSTDKLKDKDRVRAILISSDYCSNFAQDTSNVFPIHINGERPLVSISTTNNAICTGVTASFIADTLNIGKQASFQWQINNNNAGSNSKTFSSDQIKNGDRIKVILSNISSSCVADTFLTSNTITMTVNPVPSVTISGTNTSICTGGSVTLSASGAANYSWSGPNLNVMTGSSVVASPATPGSYTYSATGTTNGCSQTQTFIVSVASPPIVTIAQKDTSICEGSSVTLNSSASSGNQWYRNNISINGASSQTYVASQAGSYKVSVNNGTCSVSSKDVTVTVNPVPATPIVTAGGPTTFCEGGNVVLTSSSLNGNQWYKDGSAINGATGTSYTATQTGSYAVKTTVTSCTSSSSTATAVSVNSVPATPVITQAGTTLTSSSNSGNQWYKNGVAIAGATASSYTPIESGHYSVSVTLNGCTSAKSPVINYVVTAISSPILDKSMQIFPSPVHGKLTIKYNGTPSTFTMRLVDLYGRGLMEKQFSSSAELNLSGLTAGTYVVHIVNMRTKEHVQRLIIKL